MVLSGVCYENWQVQVFVEDLLYTTIVDVFPTVPRRLLRQIRTTFFIAKGALVGYIVRRVIAELTAGRRAGFAVEKSWETGQMMISS